MGFSRVLEDLWKYIGKDDDSLDKKKLFGYLDENPWFHIGTKDDLIRENKDLRAYSTLGYSKSLFLF